MRDFKKILFSFIGLAFSAFVLMQCASSQVSEQPTTQESSIQQNEAEASSYANLYDGRAAFPDSVHKSWQTGDFEEVRTSVLSYIDNMIEGISNDIKKYEQEGNIERVDLEKQKLGRVNELKEKIQSVSDKNAIKNAMHDEFRSGKFKELYGTGK